VIASLPVLAAVFALGATAGDGLVERRLDDVASIALPARVADEILAGARTDDAGRLVYAFATPYRWASIGSGPAYRQLLFVSYLAPDTDDADYQRLPSGFHPVYDQVRRLPDQALGSGTVSTVAGSYRQNALEEPSHTYVYRDRSRRLQIAWHSVDEDVDPETARRLLEAMARSFRVLREPVATFAEMRDRPRREAGRRTDNLRLARDALARAGFAGLEPGRPLYRNGVYAEWMSEPEPRFQLLRPLGLLRLPPGTPEALHPRPRPDLPATGSLGWREPWDGAWRFHNETNDYLPLPGIAARLEARHVDPATQLFFYAVTVRVEEADRAQVEGLGDFFRSLPAVEQAWREGRLLRGSGPWTTLPLPGE
jgi:hypothetical protein